MNALIIGLGNIGLRHLEGLSNLEDSNLNVHLFDKSNDYISRFKNEFKNLEKKIKINFCSKIESLSKTDFDITIISTDATERIKILKHVAKNINSKLIIIEKPICNSVTDLNFLKKNKFHNVFVNFPGRYCNWHKEIKDKILKDYPNQIFQVDITERNLGIACNSSHFVDLIHSWIGQYPIKVDSSELSNWKKSKRDGYFDLDGTIKITFRNNHILRISSGPHYNSLKINITGNDGKNICFMDYEKGLATFEDKTFKKGNFNRNISSEEGIRFSKLQSESTNLLYKKLVNKDIEICNLETAVKCYEKVLISFIKYWNKTYKTNFKQIMIT